MNYLASHLKAKHTYLSYYIGNLSTLLSHNYIDSNLSPTQNIYLKLSLLMLNLDKNMFPKYLGPIACSSVEK